MKRILFCLIVILPCFLLAEKQGARSSALDRSSQIIVVTTVEWNTVDGRLQRYERKTPGDLWSAIGTSIPIVVGNKGMGWGIGVLPIDGVRNAHDPEKREGDGRAPAGIFTLSSAFGYATQAPSGWKMPYLALTPLTDCVDDPRSRFYNRVLDRSTISPDWMSAEHMREAGEAYRWGAVIDYNMNPPRPRGGSCVFMHIWGGAGLGTQGCTAMRQEELESMLGWLNSAKNPLLIQMPIRQYGLFAKSLHLPTLPGPRSAATSP